jgi:xanthine dehydrogenase YagS FAD-binding subunit
MEMEFAHVDTRSLDDAAALMEKGKAAIIAGGTDLLTALRFEILPTHPAVVVNLNSIPALDHIKEEGGLLKIGAPTRLEDIAKSPIVRAKCQALAEAAHRTASPHIREMETIGGNICQLIRCWHFRNPDNRFGQPTTPLKKGRQMLFHQAKILETIHGRDVF